MSNTNILDFEHAKYKPDNTTLFTPRSGTYLLYSLEDKHYAIEPYVSFAQNYAWEFSDFRFDVTNNSISDIRVGCSITELILDPVTGKFDKKKNIKESNKKFKFKTDLLNYISKLQSFITTKLSEFKFVSRGFTIDFNNMGDYIVVENSNNYSSEQISQVISSISELSDINLTRTILLNKALRNFENDLTSVLNKTEHEISHVFKTYQEILPLVLLGYDATLEFEYEIQIGEDGTTKPDIFLVDKDNERITLIELKRADAQMFGAMYRVDTLKVKPEFSNAIHQTNVQRTKLSQSSDQYNHNIPKSILIYGNLNNETTTGADLNMIRKNLNILKYNNKDLIIMTYDEIIDRIGLLLNPNIESKE